MNRQFYSRPATIVAPELLGQRLIYEGPAGPVGGIIVETEAYMGPGDEASQAHRGPTPRTQIMFGQAGHAYIYFTYGLHYCLNVVTSPAGQASAVLIRAIEPTIGVEVMRHNRPVESDQQLTNGPAKLTQAMGLSVVQSGLDLLNSPLKLLPGRSNQVIATSPRIGIRLARDRLWRYYIRDNPYVSRTSTKITH